MSSDLLSESVNLFLDDFETSLCLPILAIIVLCTAQFVFNHFFDIGNMIYQNIRKPIAEGEQDAETTDMIGKLKGQRPIEIVTYQSYFIQDSSKKFS
ncbi:hypothetical protein RF55_16273 [Lasius niger]|uniref:Uncharacterized protein n=1 Tax=Lasius niger TaxID=67767 RepID=A0A0J7K482_LASNI|nr:hypothetical protein RF55_16273 [Lasius niger]